MSVLILDGGERAALYCDTDDEAFGPTFASAEHAADFLRWLRSEYRDAENDRARGIPRGGWFHSPDPRRYTLRDLRDHVGLWHSERVNDETSELLEVVRAGR